MPSFLHDFSVKVAPPYLKATLRRPKGHSNLRRMWKVSLARPMRSKFYHVSVAFQVNLLAAFPRLPRWYYIEAVFIVALSTARSPAVGPLSRCM